MGDLESAQTHIHLVCPPSSKMQRDELAAMVEGGVGRMFEEVPRKPTHYLAVGIPVVFLCRLGSNCVLFLANVPTPDEDVC